jgi:hypothetical protein
MKKFILFFLVLGVLIPLSSWAQKQSVMVANATENKVEIGGVIIKSRAIKELSLPVTNNVASITLSYYEGLELKGPVTLTRSVNRNRVVLRDFDPANNTAASSEDAPSASNKATFSEKPYTPDVTNTPASSSWWANVTVKLKNGLKKQTLFVPVAPFAGLSLASGDISEKPATLNTGPIIFPVKLMSEDSVKTKTGMRYTWGIVDKIVVEGDDILEIRPDDILNANEGETMVKFIVSNLGSRFIISEGESTGTVVPDRVPTKVKLYVGWNIIPIQFLDANNLPTQATLILLVDKTSRSLIAGDKNKLKNGNISVETKNIMITNHVR